MQSQAREHAINMCKADEKACRRIHAKQTEQVVWLVGFKFGLPCSRRRTRGACVHNFCSFLISKDGPNSRKPAWIYASVCGHLLLLLLLFSASQAMNHSSQSFGEAVSKGFELNG